MLNMRTKNAAGPAFVGDNCSVHRNVGD